VDGYLQHCPGGRCSDRDCDSGTGLAMDGVADLCGAGDINTCGNRNAVYQAVYQSARPSTDDTGAAGATESGQVVGASYQSEQGASGAEPHTYHTAGLLLFSVVRTALGGAVTLTHPRHLLVQSPDVMTES
jgi:hypothetical protein